MTQEVGGEPALRSALAVQASLSETRSRGLCSWLLAGALLLHNLEEGATYGAYVSVTFTVLGRRGIVSPFLKPDVSTFWTALVLITVLGWVVLFTASRGRSRPWKWRALALVAGILLVNLLIPHLPAAVLLGGYAPGVATAVVLNLPLSAYVIVEARRQLRSR